MLTLGEEVLFQIGDFEGEKVLGEIYLKYLGNYKKGIRMSGRIPNFWVKINEYIKGPKLYRDNYIYQIADLDLNKSKIWLKEVGINVNYTATEKADFFSLA